MITWHDFLTLRSARKALRELRNTFRLYEDILPPAVRQALEVRLTDLQQAIRCKETEELPALVATIRAELAEALPKQRAAWAAEAFDVVVSALAVAFCFRAYFYEPFQIPTGSMQPTLYGIHVEAAEVPDTWDRAPWKFVKWCITGKSFKDIRIKNSGIVSAYGQSQAPGYSTLVVNGRDRYDLPDAVFPLILEQLRRDQGRVRTHQRLWSGYVKSGDFLFVNRWIWNFRHPRLGETIVFSTQNLPGLPNNQHYIKRLCGRPGDRVELKPGDSHLWVNGKPALVPTRLAEIAAHERPWKGAPQYIGYQPAPASNTPLATRAQFQLGPLEYVALGDNSGNSLDSRYWGTVPARNLLGPASFVHWPFTSPRWGKIQ